MQWIVSVGIHRQTKHVNIHTYIQVLPVKKNNNHMKNKCLLCKPVVIIQNSFRELSESSCDAVFHGVERFFIVEGSTAVFLQLRCSISGAVVNWTSCQYTVPDPRYSENGYTSPSGKENNSHMKTSAYSLHFD